MNMTRDDAASAETDWSAVSEAVRDADARYVLQWVYQAGPETVPANIHDLAARALDQPSLSHGCGDVFTEVPTDTGSLSSLDELFPLATFDWSPEKYLARKMAAEFCQSTFDYSAFDAHAERCASCRGVIEEWCDVGASLWKKMPRLK